MNMDSELFYSNDGTKVMFVAPLSEMERILDVSNRYKYKNNYMLVLGNGFDLNLGLKTRYRDFVESRIFKKMYVKRMKEKLRKEKIQPSLIDYLYGKKFYERWYDIEAALLEYISRRPDGSFVNNKDEDKEDYDAICCSLIDYLTSLFKTGNDNEQSRMFRSTPAGQLIKKVNTVGNVVYSFNYTPIHLVVNGVIGDTSINPILIHGGIKEKTVFEGNLNDNAIILGVETNNMNEIAPGYSFLIKSNNPAYKSSKIASDLLNSRNVIFFGHSLNQMDFGYFVDYFKMLENNMDEERILTIITKNEESRMALLDNLRYMGITVRDIYAHTKVELILTDNLNNKASEDSISFEDLLNRISI